MEPGLGVCYYPEQWPEELWTSDAERMAAAGIAHARIGEFAWSRLEPEPGRFDPGWLLRVMDILHAARLKVVLGRPTAAPPRLLVAQMPDMLAVDENGVARKFGSRRHYCFSHQGYRNECARIVRVIAEAVKDHPSLTAWQTDNEYGCHNTSASYSTAALNGFRRGLKAKYDSIEALNTAWGNAFRSMEYRDSSEIELPNLTQFDPSPTLLMDVARSDPNGFAHSVSRCRRQARAAR